MKEFIVDIFNVVYYAYRSYGHIQKANGHFKLMLDILKKYMNIEELEVVDE